MHWHPFFLTFPVFDFLTPIFGKNAKKSAISQFYRISRLKMSGKMNWLFPDPQSAAKIQPFGKNTEFKNKKAGHFPNTETEVRPRTATTMQENVRQDV